MHRIDKSALFMRQWREHTLNYQDKASPIIAEQFVDAIEAALTFIRMHPEACPLYIPQNSHEALQKQAFRRKHLSGFPYCVFFSLHTPKTVRIEAIYADKMHIEARLQGDVTRH